MSSPQRTIYPAAQRIIMSLLVFAAVPASAGDLPGVDDPTRARTNYMLNCQGCHGHDGAGSAIGQVPRMQGFVGNFLRIPGGREFMVQVPGSANAALTNAELAELLNWLLPTISAHQMPEMFEPYSEREIARLRQQPVTDVADQRARLIDAMRQAQIRLE